MVHHQNAMGLVFHTATFSDKAALDDAIQSLRMDTSWTRRCASLARPAEVDTIPKLVKHDGVKPTDGNAWAVLRCATTIASHPDHCLPACLPFSLGYAGGSSPVVWCIAAAPLIGARMSPICRSRNRMTSSSRRCRRRSSLYFMRPTR
jgi:hypothetical protein